MKREELHRAAREAWHTPEPHIVTDPRTGKKWLRQNLPDDADIVSDPELGPILRTTEEELERYRRTVREELQA